MRVRVYHAPPPPLPQMLMDMTILDVEAKVRARRAPKKRR